MPKLKVMYCENCGKITVHNIVRDYEGFSRAFLIFATTGFSELCNWKHITCTECKYETTRTL